MDSGVLKHLTGVSLKLSDRQVFLSEHLQCIASWKYGNEMNHMDIPDILWKRL